VSTTKRSFPVEFLAIPIVLVVLGVLFALMLAADIGAWAWVVVTTVLVLLGTAAIATIVHRRRYPAGSDAPATHPAGPHHVPGDRYRVLVVADATLGAAAFQGEIGTHSGGRPVEAFVVAPALRSRVAHWTGDDSSLEDAETHLAETLDGLASAGVPARGAVGSDDPIQAADDALRTFDADEVVFVTGAGEDNWLERGVVDRARERYEIPVTHVSGAS
jgi:hypothetical protein